MTRAQYIVGGTAGWLISGAIGAAVAQEVPRRRHPILKGTLAAGATGALFTVVMSTLVAPEAFQQQSGVSGQLAGPGPRHITSSRFP